MSRTLSGGLAAHLASDAHTRCTMLRLDLVDGSVLTITDHDEPINFDLGDGAATYSPGTGIIPSDLSLSAGFEPDDIEVSGPITEGGLTTLAGIIGGRFDDAVARLFQIDWSTPASGPVLLLQGYVTKVDVEGGKFRMTVHSEITKFSQQIGRVITGYCDADFGDARCGFTPETVAATVSAVTSKRIFKVTFSGSYAANFFNRGTAIFLTGNLGGIRPVEIYDWSDTGDIALWTALPEAPEIGDTLTLRQGCYDVATNTSKTRAACMAFGNIVNFRGFPDVPGSDQVLRYPNPGSSA